MTREQIVQQLIRFAEAIHVEHPDIAACLIVVEGAVIEHTETWLAESLETFVEQRVAALKAQDN